MGGEYYKVTGIIRNGRWDAENDCWDTARITPRFFIPKLKATEFLATLERGILWKQNPEGSRNEFSVVETNNIEWPEGARG